jgi:putative flavoprotein involved in K+ transport
VRAVVFSTGFGTDYSWLRVPVVGPDGSIAHREGRTAVDGVYFVGLLWMRVRRSAIIAGAMDDSAHVAAQVAARRDTARAASP